MEGSDIGISFDRVADIYDRTRSLPKKVMNHLIKTLAAELDDCTRILDLGVGTGRFAEPMQKKGFKVVGIDISRKMISKAKKKSVRNLFLADARHIPFRDKTFDATISVHLLHLISEWRRTLGEVCRVSRHAMLSLHYARKDPVREAYFRLLEQYGYEKHYPGKAEQNLKDIVAPAKSLFVSSYNTFADESLINLEHRTSSSQWEIPEHVNLKIVQQLKTEFAGKTLRQDLYLSMWEIDSLKTHAEK